MPKKAGICVDEAAQNSASPTVPVDDDEFRRAGLPSLFDQICYVDFIRMVSMEVNFDAACLDHNLLQYETSSHSGAKRLLTFGMNANRRTTPRHRWHAQT
jgi:hypothetical protein